MQCPWLHKVIPEGQAAALPHEILSRWGAGSGRRAQPHQECPDQGHGQTGYCCWFGWPKEKAHHLCLYAWVFYLMYCLCLEHRFDLIAVSMFCQYIVGSVLKSDMVFNIQKIFIIFLVLENSSRSFFGLCVADRKAWLGLLDSMQVVLWSLEPSTSLSNWSPAVSDIFKVIAWYATTISEKYDLLWYHATWS